MTNSIEVSIAPCPSDGMIREWLIEYMISKVNELGVPHGHVTLNSQEYQDTKWADVRKSYDYSWIKESEKDEPVLIIAPSLKDIDRWVPEMWSCTYFDHVITVEPDCD